MATEVTAGNGGRLDDCLPNSYTEPHYVQDSLIPSLREFLVRSVRAGLQPLHQISYNTFSLHCIWSCISSRYSLPYYCLLLVYFLQVFLCHLLKPSTLDRLTRSYTNWCQSRDLEADRGCCLHTQTRRAEGYLCLIFYL
jgi:hypothetical protein